MPDPQTTTTETPGTVADTPKLEEAAIGSALVTGAVFVAPTSVDLPTDATTALASGYKMLSFTNSDGLRVSESSSKSEVRVWEGLSLARTVRTDRVEQAKFTPVNLNQRVAEIQWGASAVTADSSTGALAIGHHGNPVDPCHIVVETVPFAGAVQRLCFKGQLSEIGEMTLNGKDGEGRELTFDCLTLDDGMTMHEYIAYTS